MSRTPSSGGACRHHEAHACGPFRLEVPPQEPIQHPLAQIGDLCKRLDITPATGLPQVQLPGSDSQGMGKAWFSCLACSHTRLHRSGVGRTPCSVSSDGLIGERI